MTAQAGNVEINLAPASDHDALPVTSPIGALREAYGKLPLSFEVNESQTNEGVDFMARGAGYSLFLARTEAVFVLRGKEAAPKSRGGKKGAISTSRRAQVLGMQLAGANREAVATAMEELPGKVSYFSGNDPTRWRTGVPTYRRVRYQEVYRGIDVIYYGNQQQLEYDFIVQPEADYKQIKLAFKGAKRIKIEPGSGDLLVQTKTGVLRQHQPQVYQEVDGKRQAMASHYIKREGGRIGFEVEGYDATRPLVIDPTLSYSTYLGGNSDDYAYGIAVDSSGNAYVTGGTSSTDFPTQNPLQATYGGNQDAFVTKFSADGASLVYSTYLGGNSDDRGDGIAVDSSGNAYATGYTTSTNFPTKDPLQANKGLVEDAFVTKISADGASLVYSTYLGGNGSDYGYGIAVDSAGNAYPTGYTYSTNFPTKNPLQANKVAGSNADTFIAQISDSPLPKVSITSITRIAGGFLLQGVGVPSAVHRIQATGSLLQPFDPNPVGTATADGNGNFQFTDNTSLSQRFYRVVYP